MPIDTTPLREDRHKFVVDGRAILDKAEDEKRTMTAEERGEYDKLFKAAESKRAEIEDGERRNDQERVEAEEELRQKDEEAKRNKDSEEEKTTLLAPANDRMAFSREKVYERAFAKAICGRSMDDEEIRALTAGTGTEGGYLYASQVFSEQIIANVTDATIFRQMGVTTFSLPTADSMGNPTLTNRMSDAAWTSELGIPSRDTSLKFGKRALTPHPLAKEIPVSKVLIRKSPQALEIVRSELARVVAEAQENAFMTGDGSQKPLGIFTASADGISTGRDVSSGNTATQIKFDGLKAAKYSIKQVYWGALQWMFHRNGMERIAKLKDGEGRYLLQDSVVLGEPDRILGFPVRLSEFVPSTFTASQYVGIIGDFSNYWIVDSLAMEIARLEELLARQNQDLFIIRSETDGAPVREEAFARVKLTA